MTALTTLLEPFAYAFFVKGVVVATLAGSLCGLIGVYVTLRGMSYIGHGLAHAIFGGFAASAVLGINVVLGAGVWGLGSALAIGSVTRRRRIGSDAAIGVITTASFALGVALLKKFGGRDGAANFDQALFGSILGVRTSDIWLIAGVGVATLAVIFVRYRALLFTTFDPDVAAASGVSVRRADALLMVVLSAAILATLTVIGVTLVAAALVIPAVIARLVTNSFARMLVVSTLVGGVCGFVGMNLSYHLDVPSGTAIVLTGAAVFCAALAFTGPRRLRRFGAGGRTAPAPVTAGV